MFYDKVRALPNCPGVYIMRDQNGEIIYVGKAKNLKNRVSQYFQSGKSHTPKVAAMVSNVADFEYIMTETEFEALVLECNLIKSHRPKYNILLKDDKGYPYIKVTVNEPYPRILLARRVDNDGGRYFGPYLNTSIFNEIIDIAKKVFAIRSCKKVLPRDIGKGRPCLNYFINQCSAPCDNRISQQEYKSAFDDIIALLEGKHDETVSRLTEQMKEASARLEFERAAKIRDKISAIVKMSEKQRVVSTSLGNQDVIAFAQEGKTVCIQIFFMRSGKIVGRENYIVKNEQDSVKSRIMTDFVKQYYGMSSYIPKSIILQTKIEDRVLIEKWLSEKCGASIKIITPQKGEKLSIVNMVERNALEALKLYMMNKDKGKRKINDLLFELKETLGLKAAPMRIEAYDISNISGRDSVGVCVVFENGLSKKSDYRKFNIRTVEGSNDYESIKEVLYRRISNGIEGEEGFTPLPDLILLDGGKGHVNSAAEIMGFFRLDIPFFGLVKDDRHRTRGLTTGTEELAIKRQSASFAFLTRIQDEVHRFAVESHRKKHTKSLIASELESIQGVGEKRRALLLKHFKTVKALKEATKEEIISVKGIDKKTAEKIYDFFNGDV